MLLDSLRLHYNYVLSDIYPAGFCNAGGGGGGGVVKELVGMDYVLNGGVHWASERVTEKEKGNITAAKKENWRRLRGNGAPIIRAQRDARSKGRSCRKHMCDTCGRWLQGGEKC